jgi:hypothetical protein
MEESKHFIEGMRAAAEMVMDRMGECDCDKGCAVCRNLMNAAMAINNEATNRELREV